MLDFFKETDEEKNFRKIISIVSYLIYHIILTLLSN